MTVFFPDIEPLIVAHLKDALASVGYGSTFVATKKPAADSSQHDSAVIVTGSYQTTLDLVRRDASAVIDIYAVDYATASELAGLVAALIVDIVGDPIKRASIVLGPVRQTDEGPQEKRSLSVDFIVKGQPI